MLGLYTYVSGFIQQKHTGSRDIRVGLESWGPKPRLGVSQAEAWNLLAQAWNPKPLPMVLKPRLAVPQRRLGCHGPVLSSVDRSDL